MEGSVTPFAASSTVLWRRVCTRCSPAFEYSGGPFGDGYGTVYFYLSLTIAKGTRGRARAPAAARAAGAGARSAEAGARRGYACCLRRAGVVTEMPPAPPRTVPAMPSGFAGALIRDGGALPAHDLLLGGAPSAARNEAPQPMSGTGALGRTSVIRCVCYSLQQAPCNRPQQAGR